VEPISPELVLVDPELARVARARLATSGDIAILRRAAEAVTFTPPQERRRLDIAVKQVRERLTVTLLGVSVAVNGAFTAALLQGDGARRSAVRAISVEPLDAQPRVSPKGPVQKVAAPPRVGNRAAASSRGVQHVRREGTHVRRVQPVTAPPVPVQTVRTPWPTVTTREVAGTTAVERIRKPPRESARPAGRIPTVREVERRIVKLVLRSPRKTLPPQLIDARTGLPKNNLRISCRHERARIFRCVIGLVSDARHRVVVRYRVLLTGRGIYSWSRPGSP
jgi:hypothetical protein